MRVFAGLSGISGTSVPKVRRHIEARECAGLKSIYPPPGNERGSDAPGAELTAH
jgi:hypothetical protein